MTREEIHEMAQCLDPKIEGKAVDPDYICNDIYDFSIGCEVGALWANKHNCLRVCDNIHCDQRMPSSINMYCITKEEADKHSIKVEGGDIMVSLDAVYRWLLEIEDGTIITDTKQFANSFLKDIQNIKI